MKLLKPIILEGVDGTGKTTLFNYLTGTLNLKSAGHDGGPPEDAADVWRRLALTAAEGAAVRDRTPAISDFVYAKVFKRDPKIPMVEALSWLQKFKPLVIHCSIPPNKILAQKVETKPHKSKEHVAQVESNLWNLIIEYQDLMDFLQDQGGVQVLLYDWTLDQNYEILTSWLLSEGICAE